MNKELELIVAQATPVGTEKMIKSNLWQLVNATVFRVFPTKIKKPRIMLLQLFGAKLAKTVTISRTAKIAYPWNLEMGHFSSLGAHSCVNCHDKIKIGEKCRIGENVKLLAGNHATDGDSIDQTTRTIFIDNGCWISAGSCILQGVKLGNYTMVSEKSLVDKDTEPYSIVAGRPAKAIKKAFITS